MKAKSLCARRANDGGPATSGNLVGFCTFATLVDPHSFDKVANNTKLASMILSVSWHINNIHMPALPMLCLCF